MRLWAALGGQPPAAGLTHLPCCPQQLNAIIAASMSLKSSSKLRNILEVRGARPWPHGGMSGRAGCTLAVLTCPMRPDCVGAWGADVPPLLGSAPRPFLSPCTSSDRAGLRELHEQQQARGCLRLPAAEPRCGRFGAGLPCRSLVLWGRRWCTQAPSLHGDKPRGQGITGTGNGDRGMWEAAVGMERHGGWPWGRGLQGPSTEMEERREQPWAQRDVGNSHRDGRVQEPAVAMGECWE